MVKRRGAGTFVLIYILLNCLKIVAQTKNDKTKLKPKALEPNILEPKTLEIYSIRAKGIKNLGH